MLMVHSSMSCEAGLDFAKISKNQRDMSEKKSSSCFIHPKSNNSRKAKFSHGRSYFSRFFCSQSTVFIRLLASLDCKAHEMVLKINVNRT